MNRIQRVCSKTGHRWEYKKLVYLRASEKAHIKDWQFDLCFKCKDCGYRQRIRKDIINELENRVYRDAFFDKFGIKGVV